MNLPIKTLLIWISMQCTAWSADQIAIAVTDVSSSEKSYVITFVVENKGDTLIYINSPFSSRARQQLTVVFVDKKGGEMTVMRRFLESSGASRSERLPPGKKLEFKIDLRDGEWDVVTGYGGRGSDNFYLEFNCPVEPRREAVWAGNVKSKVTHANLDLYSIFQ